MIKRVFQGFRSSHSSFRPPDVILHIGAPKCGSSAIQRFCVMHHDQLLSQGYFYPQHSLDKNGVSGGHTHLAGPLLKGDTEHAKRILQNWLAKAGQHKACLLLSAEAFYGQHAAIASLCEGLTVKVVGFLRHPVEYLLGNHNQGIKRHMSTQRLSELIPGVLSGSVSHLVGMPLLRWADAFGDQNCRFLPYHPPFEGSEPHERRFLEMIGISTQHAKKWVSTVTTITNRSYVRSALELKRLLNTVLPDLPDAAAHQVDWSLQGYSDRATQEQAYRVGDLSLELRVKLNEHLLGQMAPVVARFPQLAPLAELSSPESHEENSGWLSLESPLAALQQDAADIYQQVHQRAVQLRDTGRQDYPFYKLLDVLGIEFVEPKACPQGLLEGQRKVIANEKSRDADYLREFAMTLERYGHLEDALQVISRAQDKRPKGAGIRRIKERIEGKLGNQTANLETTQASSQL